MIVIGEDQAYIFCKTSGRIQRLSLSLEINLSRRGSTTKEQALRAQGLAAARYLLIKRCRRQVCLRVQLAGRKKDVNADEFQV